MQRQFRNLAVALVAGTLAVSAGAQDKGEGDYRLHAGDSITVSVWKELDLQRKVMIRPDGRFSFPAPLGSCSVALPLEAELTWAGLDLSSGEPVRRRASVALTATRPRARVTLTLPDTRVVVEPDMVHDWHSFAGLFSGCARAIDDVGAFVRSVVI